MEFNTLLFVKEDGIAIITLNRPKTYNAINEELIAELDQAMDAIIADAEIKAVIITGGTRVFAAGADIQAMSTMGTMQAERFVENCKTTFDKIYRLDRPVIAAIGGLALGGGCELAMVCDIRIASAGSQFGQPEINLGIIPGGGGTQRLTRIVGSGWARYLLMTGKNIDADTALRIGLVNAVVPKEQLMEEARKIAVGLASKAPLAMKAIKDCVNYGEDVDLNSGLKYELKTWAGLFSTEDQTEGMTAFLEKRQPEYKGK